VGKQGSLLCKPTPTRTATWTGNTVSATPPMSTPIITLPERVMPPQKPTLRLKRGQAHDQASDEAIRRSRGSLTTKIHVFCEGKWRPLSIQIPAGQVHESTRLEPLLDGMGVRRPGRGRPRKRVDSPLTRVRVTRVGRAFVHGRGLRQMIPKGKINASSGPRQVHKAIVPVVMRRASPNIGDSDHQPIP